MAQESQMMEAVLKATDQSWSKGFKDAENAVNQFEGNTKRAMDMALKAVTAATVAVGAAVAGLAIKGTKDFVGFEKQMNEVFTLMPDVSDKAMGEMTGQVKDFAKEFGTLPEEVVPALYSAISAGVPSDNVFSFLEVAQKAAVGGVTELETAVDGISSVVNAYGDDVIDAGQASDQMFTAVKLGKTTFDELSSSLFNVIPTAAGLGVEFGDVTAALAAMTAQGTPTSVATTQMRQVLVELSKEGGKTSDTFQEMAGKTFKDFIAEGGNVQGALQLMEQAAADNGVGISDMFGSVEAGNAALALTGKGTEAFSKALDEMGNSAGATDTAFETMEQGLGRSFEKIKAALSVMSIEIGEKLAPYVAKFADAFLENMPAIQAVVENVMDAAIAAIEAFANSSAFEAIKNAFTTIIDYISEVDFAELFKSIGDFIDKWSPLIAGIIAGVVAFKAIIGVITLVQGAITVLSAAFAILTSPIGLIALAIGALVAIGVLLYKNWDTIKAKTSEIWNKVKTTVVTAITDVKEKIQEIMRSVLDIVGGIWTSIYDTWTGWIDSIFDSSNSQFNNLKDAIDGIMDGIWNIFMLYWDYIYATFENAVNFVKALLNGDFGAMKAIVEDQLTLLKDTVLGIWENIKQIFSSAIDYVVAFAKGKFEEFQNKLSEIWNSISETASTIWETIKTSVSTIVSTLVDGVVGYFTRLYESFETTITPLVEMFTNIFGTIKDYILSTWDNIVTVGTELWNIIKNVVLGIVIVFLELLRGNFEGAKEAINNVWENIKESALIIWTAIKDQVMLIIDTFITVAKEIFTGMKDSIIGTYETLKNRAIEIFTNMKNSVIEFFTNLKNNVTTTVTNLKNDAINRFNTLKDNAINAVRNMKNDVIAFFTNLTTSGTNKATELKDNVKNGFRDMVNGAVDKAKELPGKIKEEFEKVISKAKEFIDKAVQVGKDIVGGFVKGVTQKAVDIKNAVGDAIGGAIEWAKEKLDSHSPSRVFQQLGIWTDEGYAKGIDDGAKEPIKAIGKVMDGVIGAWDTVSLNKEANIASNFAVNQSEVDRAMNSLVDVPSMNFSGNANYDSRVTHEINHNTQPMELSLQLGGRHYRAFVGDITDTQNAQIQLEEGYTR